MPVIFFLFLCLYGSFSAIAQSHGGYHHTKSPFDHVAFYVCAHQDDWQLFMGTNAYNDINDINDVAPIKSKKVVFIYTTAGNLHEANDTTTCNCVDSHDPQLHHMPYWKVREEGANNSIHLASCRVKGWGPIVPAPRNQKEMINGHSITKYTYKNTTSYFLRLRCGEYSRWRYDHSLPVSAIDTSTTYTDWADFVNTLYYIFTAEVDSNNAGAEVSFNTQDVDEAINPSDNFDHYLAGRATCEAARLVGDDHNICYPEYLFTDYHSADLPPNLQSPDIQNEAALVAVYCMSLLDNNAWQEWGTGYQELTERNYFRPLTTCDAPCPNHDIMEDDSLNTLGSTVFPNPVSDVLHVQFNRPVKSNLQISISTITGSMVLEQTMRLDCSNTLKLPVDMLAPGLYNLSIVNCGKVAGQHQFMVAH